MRANRNIDNGHYSFEKNTSCIAISRIPQPGVPILFVFQVLERLLCPHLVFLKMLKPLKTKLSSADANARFARAEEEGYVPEAYREAANVRDLSKHKKTKKDQDKVLPRIYGTQTLLSQEMHLLMRSALLFAVFQKLHDIPTASPLRANLMSARRLRPRYPDAQVMRILCDIIL